MASSEDAVEVPCCCVCRRSSDLKWRKHVFSKGHQRAAVEFLAVRVASFEVTKAKIVSQETNDQGKLYCVFCEVDIKSLRHWTKHHASASHRKKLNDFCKHHRCVAAQQTRQQLCLPVHEADTLLQALDDQERRREAAQGAPTPQTTTTPSVFVSSSHIEAFMNTVAARLQDVRSNREQASRSASGVSRSPMVPQHQDWQASAGTVAQAGSKIMHKTTEQAHGSGLGTVRRVDWGGQIANVHSFAIPPWMVDTEEEYKRLNQRSNPSASGKAAKRKQPSSSRDQEGTDIFARLKPNYDEDTWLPNFGGVWQEGPRSKTRKDFGKARLHEPPKRERPEPDVRYGSQPLVDVQNPPQSLGDGQHTPEEVATERPLPPPTVEAMNESASASLEVPVHTNKRETQPAPSLPVEQPPVSALDAKKSLLLAQKERLRAKFAAKKNSQS